ncbi:MAG: sialate O-acetylesterase [Firmicutes bacterium]|nr:sialate O-acetylesterase [Bacillota bacterium]
MKENFNLAPIFTDYMVFQTGKPIHIFGSCKKGVEIKVLFFNNEVKIKTKSKQFLIELPSSEVVKQGFSFTVVSKRQSKTIYNCLVGDVYLIAGESNVEFPLKESNDTLIQEQALIRYFDVPSLPYEGAEKEFPTIYKSDSKWLICDKESPLCFSALGYYISHNIFENIRIPVGIISCNYANTSIFSWMNYQDILENEKLRKHLKEYQEEIYKFSTTEEYDKCYKEKVYELQDYENKLKSLSQQGVKISQIEDTNLLGPKPELPIGPKHPNRPSGIYNSMLKTIFLCHLKGIIYYQGESDVKNDSFYQEAFQTLVKSWRREFNNLRLPFFFTQIAGYNYPLHESQCVSNIRDAQTNCINPNNQVFMVSAIDVGDEFDINPKDKCVISQRIANVILEKIYHTGKNSLSPAYFSYQFSKNKLIIYTQFNHLNLVSKSRQNKGIYLSEDGLFFYETNKVELMNNQIVISNIKNIKEVRYAIQPYPICDIYSSNELPLLPFKVKIDI